jgi:REP element-mobilizing transposase RayT
VPGAFYHVISKGNRGDPIFVDRETRRVHLNLCGLIVKRHGWRCHAFCQMGNHFHLLVETPEPNISRGMQQLNARYAQWFNWRHGFYGHLFKGRFWSALVETDEYFVELSRYVVLNPVRAAFCDDVADWPWSSYRKTVGLAREPHFLTSERLLEHFSSDITIARAAYARFVLAGSKVWRPDMSWV